MPQSNLFKPLRIRNLELENRITIAPMCTYSAVDGCMTDWHLIHLGQLALSGAALLTIEATAVVPEGRISYADVGLYDDATEAAMKRVLDGFRAGLRCRSPSSLPMPAERHRPIFRGSVAGRSLRISHMAGSQRPLPPSPSIPTTRRQRP